MLAALDLLEGTREIALGTNCGFEMSGCYRPATAGKKGDATLS